MTKYEKHWSSLQKNNLMGKNVHASIKWIKEYVLAGFYNDFLYDDCRADINTRLH